MNGLLLVRADASASAGIGHVMRCRTLAEEWRARGGQAAFAAAELPPALRERLTGDGFDVIDVDAPPGSERDAVLTVGAARERAASLVVIDGYPFDAAYQQRIAAARLLSLVVDDHVHAASYDCDLLLNQNVYATAAMYPRVRPGTRMLMGARYAMLRREFEPWRSWQRTIPPRAARLLVTLGGADPRRLTQHVLRGLERVEGTPLEVVAVAGGATSAEQREELVALAGRSRHAIRILQNVNDMAPLMAEADLTVAAAGTTSWELAFMGLPNLQLVLADNQQKIADSLDALGASIKLGNAEDLTETRLAEAVSRVAGDSGLRARMSRIARELVDGQGASRVVAAIEEAVSASSVSRK